MPTFPYYLWNQWYLAGRSDQVRPGKPFSTTIMETRLVLFRTADGALHALRDRCLHLGASLALGKVRNDCLSCPFHGWTYDADGACVDIPALGEPTPALQHMRLARFPVCEAAGLVWIFMRRDSAVEPTTDPVPAELRDPSWRPYLIEDMWPVNYTRFAENMLDQIHLPYVHHNTIGRHSRKRGPLMPVITAHEHGFDVGNGQLTFTLPNAHHLVISPTLHQLMWGVPVGPSLTHVYILGIRKMARWGIFDPLFKAANRFILNQDKPVVLSQQPDHVTFEPHGDMLIRPDTAAKAYRELLARTLAAQPDAPPMR